MSEENKKNDANTEVIKNNIPAYKPGELDKIKFKESIQAFSDDEKEMAVRNLPSECLWQELIRRNTLMVGRVNNIEDILGISIDNIRPITIKAWEDIKKRYDDVEEKYKRIKKGFGGGE